MAFLKKEFCVSMEFASMESNSGNPEVEANIPPIVQVVPFVECAPFNNVSEPEKFSFSFESCVNCGMKFSSNPPPFSLFAYVISIDSRYRTITFLFFSGNVNETSYGST